jgi:predicted transcriptional regulator/DNA-binding XRE family transcriptional regulator
MEQCDLGKLTGKVVEASIRTSPEAGDEVGLALRNLRKLSGLTQVEMASRLRVQQAAVSKIETGSDQHVSTIRKYVEALGASLRIDASFGADTPLALHLRDAFDVEYGDDDQLVLPLLDDDSFRPQRDVVLSIRPQYSSKIIAGQKTVELRRRFPVLAPKGTIAYIYSTSPVMAMVGEAEIRDVVKLSVDEIWKSYRDIAFIEKPDFDRYFEGLDEGFVLHFVRARAFAVPMPLSDLRERFGFEPPQSFLYVKHELRKALRDEHSVVSY